jgi:hypothetical protein
MFKMQWVQQMTVSSKILCPHLLLIYICSTFPCRHAVVTLHSHLKCFCVLGPFVYTGNFVPNKDRIYFWFIVKFNFDFKFFPAHTFTTTLDNFIVFKKLGASLLVERTFVVQLVSNFIGEIFSNKMF